MAHVLIPYRLEVSPNVMVHAAQEQNIINSILNKRKDVNVVRWKVTIKLMCLFNAPMDTKRTFQLVCRNHVRASNATVTQMIPITIFLNINALRLVHSFN